MSAFQDFKMMTQKNVRTKKVQQNNFLRLLAFCALLHTDDWVFRSRDYVCHMLFYEAFQT